MKKRFVISLSAPSCSGKSTLIDAIAKRMPNIYTVSYDKLKWQLSGYNRDKHKVLIKEITLGLFDVICKKHLPILLDLFIKDKAEYMKCYKIAKKYGYRLFSVKLAAPKKVLLSRFRERVKSAKMKGTKISVTDENLFISNLSEKPFTPADTLVFDTSVNSADYIADKIIKKLNEKI